MDLLTSVLHANPAYDNVKYVPTNLFSLAQLTCDQMVMENAIIRELVYVEHSNKWTTLGAKNYTRTRIGYTVILD